ncbi:phenylalanine--tRNA ligase subunit beta [Sporolactobacillus shoreicorticis]|uniref:Phenylalanine--tRNA ligase beta subunit n=1 Tax=Sporolactobacillus shoreicorticis TaxID=1923877 RepID=A0ABW5RZK3_9BACL|nr:phenylalanine--tRNA ligase subunit beta [Sporolactobacillus shoreicorticis]MCO7124794.1 phenylalanine--tRNA ligase subunit beta [Sporolactobacillus shoreicorticis]
MLVSYKWLQDYVDLSGITPEELADKITNSGIEVEHIVYPGEGLKGIVVGKVESCEQHPEAEKLHLCQVDLGAESVQIVCGAPNVAAGQKVPVATVGARIANNVKIKRAKLRGEISNGMICSLDELGFDHNYVPKEYADGIYVFDDEVPVGADALPYLNLDDAILDLDILVNSAHCMNMIGVAYEVGAILDRPIKLKKPEVIESDQPASEKISISVDAGDKVSYYGARVLNSIKVAPSPRWMQLRLINAGVRPISNVVDVSNYVMLEYGQPLHTFDFDQFGSDHVLVRFAGDHEEITTLDGQLRKLTDEDLLITNGKKGVAVAGVMGGENTEVSRATENVLLEAAIFDPISIRKTAARLQLRSDASSRYEKGLDRNRVALAADRAAELLVRYAHATVLKGIVEVGERTVDEHQITMPWQKINQVLGADFTCEQIVGILRRLNFIVDVEDETMHVSVPARRFDVTIPEDLVEEVGRIYGYNHIPATLPEGTSSHASLTPYQKIRRRVEGLMNSMGLTQAYTYSLTSKENASFYVVNNQGVEPTQVVWPMSEEHAALRQSIVPQLINVAQYHLNRQMPDIKFYEIGKVFLPVKGEARPAEEEHLAGIITGKRTERNWEGESDAVDFFSVKGIVESLLDSLAVGDQIVYAPSKREGMHPGQTADILFKGEVIGYLGTLHPKVEKDYGLSETFVFELAIESLLHHGEADIKYHGLPRFPSTTRDIALVVKRTVAAADLDRVIRENGTPLLKSVRLFDVYEGSHVAPDEKSMAFSLVYFDPERTLTDEEVTIVHEKIVRACAEQLGAELRG